MPEGDMPLNIGGAGGLTGQLGALNLGAGGQGAIDAYNQAAGDNFNDNILEACKHC